MMKKLLEIYGRMSKRERMVLYGATLVLALLSMDRLVVGPLIHRMVRLDTEIRDQEASIKKSLHVLLQKERILAESKEFMAYSVEGKNPEQEMVSLLKEIESLADRAGASLLYVKPAKEEGEGEIRKYFASVEAEAQMEQVADFFHAIESSTKLLKIEKYDIQPKSKDSSIARCVATISKTVLSK